MGSFTTKIILLGRGPMNMPEIIFCQTPECGHPEAWHIQEDSSRTDCDGHCDCLKFLKPETTADPTLSVLDGHDYLLDKAWEKWNQWKQNLGSTLTTGEIEALRIAYFAGWVSHSEITRAVRRRKT
jgi:hypothetical protein